MTARCAMVVRNAALTLAATCAVPMFGTVAAADVELGRYLATECITCHRAASVQGAIPNIYGVAEPTLAEVLKAYRDKKLPNQVMQNISSRLSDDEIAALAAYFAITKKPN